MTGPEPPDLTTRPHTLRVERLMLSHPSDLYDAWTQWFELWFAARGSVSMNAEVNAPFFFQTDVDGTRHAHYGRFLRLEHDRLVTVELTPHADSTLLRLTHAGFPTAELKDQHARAWPAVLNELDARLIENSGA